MDVRSCHTGSLVQELSTDGVEGQTLTPNRGSRSLVDALDEGTENTCMAVGAAQSDQDTVGVPGDAGDSAAKGLLQVLGHPPVVLFLKVADGSNPGTATDGELCLVRRPSHTCSGSVDAEEDESRAPGAVRGLPDVCVAVLRAGDNLARVGSNVDACDELVVTA